jgi:hypothetical protein
MSREVRNTTFGRPASEFAKNYVFRAVHFLNKKQKAGDQSFTPIAFNYDNGVTDTVSDPVSLWTASTDATGALTRLDINLNGGGAFNNLTWTPTNLSWSWGINPSNPNFQVNEDGPVAWSTEPLLGASVLSQSTETPELPSALLLLVGLGLLAVVELWRRS